MFTLALDTSTHIGSLTLIQDQTIIASQSWDRLNSHCEILIEEIAKILKQNEIDASQINKICVGIGPGSFTGVRVAINFAKSFSFMKKIEIIPLNSLHLLALQVEETELPILCAQFGFRNLLYVSKYKLDKGLIFETQSPKAITIERFLLDTEVPHYILGTGFESIQTHINSEQIQMFRREPKWTDHPQAKYFSKVLRTNLMSLKSSDWTQVEPLYIRASEAEEKLRSRETT